MAFSAGSSRREDPVPRTENWFVRRQIAKIARVVLYAEFRRDIGRPHRTHRRMTFLRILSFPWLSDTRGRLAPASAKDSGPHLPRKKKRSLDIRMNLTLIKGDDNN